MEASERDTADDWRIQPGSAPATVVELEGRIDVALATARSAEEAALEIGAASLEAAEQARRAAALAERASAAAMRAAGEVAAAPRVVELPRREPPAPPTEERPLEPRRVQPVPNEAPASTASDTAPADPEPPVSVPAVSEAPAPLAAPPSRKAPRRPDPFDERLTAFRERAESVMLRLQKLEAGSAPGTTPPRGRDAVAEVP